MLTVADAIRALQELDPDLPVLRSDTDWGGVWCREVSETLFSEAGDFHAWEVMYPEVEPYEDEIRFKGVLIR